MAGKFLWIMAAVLLSVQLLHYGAARALAWWLGVRRRPVLWTVFLIGNTIILLSILRWMLSPRWVAAWLALLWFACLSAGVVLLLGKCAFRHHPQRQRVLRITAAAIFLALPAWSVYHAYVPVVRHISITLDKPLAKPLRIGMAADTHWGVLAGKRQIRTLAQIMQREQADVILMPGDIMDDNTAAYEAENMHSELLNLRAPLGVYATLGNHDLFGHQQQITQALQRAGIRVLNDEAVLLDGRVWVAGRPDKLDSQRLPTERLLAQTNAKQPIILLDHRPDDAEAHAQMPIDIQLSGHVHNGQVFPLNLLVRALNRIHYGYERINQTHFVVTSGYGFWGVPLRLGSQAEVWIIDVNGKQP